MSSEEYVDDEDLFEGFGEGWLDQDKEERNAGDDWYEAAFPDKERPERLDFQTALSRGKKNRYEIDHLLNR